MTKNPEDGSVQSRNICRVSLKCFKDLHIFRINVHPVGVLNGDKQMKLYFIFTVHFSSIDNVFHQLTSAFSWWKTLYKQMKLRRVRLGKILHGQVSTEATRIYVSDLRFETQYRSDNNHVRPLGLNNNACHPFRKVTYSQDETVWLGKDFIALSYVFTGIVYEPLVRAISEVAP
jgi:hypothetical protein